jgi:hypothetical protein
MVAMISHSLLTSIAEDPWHFAGGSKKDKTED